MYSFKKADFLVVFAICLSSPVQCYGFDLRTFSQHQANSYLNHDWNHFFGAASVYRKTAWYQNSSIDLIKLEILALLQFCRYPEARQLARGLESWAKSQDLRQTDLISTQTLISLVASMSEAQLDVRPNTDRSKSQQFPTLQTMEIQLPITEKALRFFNPSQFSLKISSQCVAKPDLNESEELNSQVEKTKLLIKEGLESYHGGKWVKSIQFFKQLKQSGKLSLQSLAEYYLGWIDINQNKPQKAVQRWNSWIRHQPSLPSQWRVVFFNALLHAKIVDGINLDSLKPDVGKSSTQAEKKYLSSYFDLFKRSEIDRVIPIEAASPIQKSRSKIILTPVLILKSSSFPSSQFNLQRQFDQIESETLKNCETLGLPLIGAGPISKSFPGLNNVLL